MTRCEYAPEGHGQCVLRHGHQGEHARGTMNHRLPTVIVDGREVPAVRCECGDGSCMMCSDEGYRAADERPLVNPRLPTASLVTFAAEMSDLIDQAADSGDTGQWLDYARLLERQAIDMISERRNEESYP